MDIYSDLEKCPFVHRWMNTLLEEQHNMFMLLAVFNDFGVVGKLSVSAFQPHQNRRE